MKKILLSAAAAAAIATGAMTLGTTNASAGYYNYTTYHHVYKPVCYKKYRTKSYRKRVKIWNYGYYRWVWKTFYKRVPYTYCEKGYY